LPWFRARRGRDRGRQIFANTVKHVLMGTSSNFGNMFSPAGASIFVAFLPMPPSQILLKNMMDDSSQLAIPTDEVDPELVARPPGALSRTRVARHARWWCVPGAYPTSLRLRPLG
jgi:magnesium-transporting ATPase (P-type)